MKPGMTIVPEQSTTSASLAEMLGATCAIVFAVDQDVGLLEVADLRVEGEHDAAAQQDAALAAVNPPPPGKINGKASPGSNGVVSTSLASRESSIARSNRSVVRL